MNINFESYKLFYYVATELSFSQAAKRLFISQSAVSQGISLLEKELNTKLFIRTTKKVTLSDDGQILLSHIEPAINSIIQGEKRLMETASLERGRLHIGVSDTICKYYLIPYLKKFHETYPNIEILITNRTSIECIDLLKKHLVDLIITNLPNSEIDSTIHIIETRTFYDIVIAPKSFSQLHRPGITFRELLKYPILLLDKQSSTTRFLQSTFRKEGLILHPSIELGSIDLLIEMATIGLGITFIPDYVYKESSETFVVDMKIPLKQRKLGIATQAKTHMSNTTRAFIDIITE